MKTMAIVDCGDVVCDKCMWLRDNWCELFDVFPEKTSDGSHIPHGRCMDGRKSVRIMDKLAVLVSDPRILKYIQPAVKE